MERLNVKAADENLDQVLAWIQSALEEAGCPPRIQNQLCIAAEEIFINIAHYAYGDRSGEAEVWLELSSAPRKVTLTFSDSGTPYDPLAKEDPDITLSAEQRQIGGLGIYMVKKTMDRVSYEYRDGKNRFTMEKGF